MPSVRAIGSAGSLRAISYEDTRAAQPPIPITVATHPPLQQPNGITGVRKSKFLPDQLWLLRNARSKLYNDDRRDSGLAPSSSTVRDSRTTLSTDFESSRSLQNSPLLPQDSTPEDGTECTPTAPKTCDAPSYDRTGIPSVPQAPLLGIVTEIPTGSFDDLTLPGQVEFSSRGSMLIGGRKARNANGSVHAKPVRSRKQSVHLSPPTSTVPNRILSADEAILSNKIRSMYEDRTDQKPHGNESPPDTQDQETESSQHRTSVPNPSGSGAIPGDSTIGAASSAQDSRSPPAASRDLQSLIWEEEELAGGIEDWKNVGSGDVDRYGFIVPSQASQDSSLNSVQSKPRDPHVCRESLPFYNWLRKLRDGVVAK